ncbi:MAG: MotA/TolQ/ExbB proton channel family protein [Methyloceanibacter sp.]|nr:MotA/TolQ/ExbB proton channel family protein [Methyloceanibacter sp.]
MNPDDAALALGEPSMVAPSVPGLILDAPYGVQFAIAALLIALIWSLVEIVRKLIQLEKARKEADKFEKVFWSGQALDELYQALSQRRNGGLASVFVVAMREWKRSTENENGQPAARPMPGVQGRIEAVANVALSRDAEGLGRGSSILSIVAATAPLIGLFGLAWGLMSAFQAAAGSDATLAVLAPGAAQGLFTAALGWFVAVPAKVFSLKLDVERARYTARLKRFSDEFSAILSRQLDRAA